MKLFFDESLSPRLVQLLSDLFPESESGLRSGLAGVGDRRILDYAAAHDFILVSYRRIYRQRFRWVVEPGPRCQGHHSSILRYPTDVAAKVLRHHAIRIAELPSSENHLIVIDR
jgi:Domain of unknown function (DUF5615)